MPYQVKLCELLMKSIITLKRCSSFQSDGLGLSNVHRRVAHLPLYLRFLTRRLFLYISQSFDLKRTIQIRHLFDFLITLHSLSLSYCMSLLLSRLGNSFKPKTLLRTPLLLSTTGSRLLENPSFTVVFNSRPFTSTNYTLSKKKKMRELS
jgi:hypothetical protein